MSSQIHKIIDQQVRRWGLEAESRRASARESSGVPAPLRPYVTIGRMFGSGGGEVAQRLAAKLGYEIFDKEILEVIVLEGHFRSAMLETLDERDRSSLEIWVDGLLHGSIVDKGDYFRRLVRVLGSIAMHGHAVIIGRGANFVLDPAKGLHVRMVAPKGHRVEAIRQLRGISYGEAERLVSQIDHERAAFVQHHFHRDIHDPIGYDLVLNTAGTGITGAVELIERALRWKLGAQPAIRI